MKKKNKQESACSIAENSDAPLQIKNLSKTYPNGVQALKNVSLEIGKGMYGLLGQNGAGKSTLMRTIATLQDADSGTITFNGFDVMQQPHELRKVLGYLPQEFGVYPTVTAEEFLTHIADMKGIANKAERRNLVDELLVRTNLYDVRKKRLNSYSGGMKQRFGIAQALIGNPELIIVDEPTAGLDPMERNRFYNLLSEIGENTVVILSTHIVEDVSTLCNQMAIIGQGEVLIAGNPAEIEKKLQGKIFEKEVGKNEVSLYKNNYEVISQNFHLGKMHITIYAQENPGNGFNVKECNLEDTYFHLLFNQKKSQTVC